MCTFLGLEEFGDGGVEEAIKNRKEIESPNTRRVRRLRMVKVLLGISVRKPLVAFGKSASLQQ